MVKRFGPLAVLIVLVAVLAYVIQQRSAYTDFKALDLIRIGGQVD